jgi:acyl dehydratase
MTTSLITDEVRAQLGQLTQPPVTAQITARDAQRYAMAVDDLNPVYFDEDAAHAAGYRTLVAPPTFVGHVVAATKPLTELREDGLFRGVTRLRLGLPRVMAGGDAWEYLAPAYVGDVVTAESRLASVEQHEGRNGAFVTSVVETVFTDQRGEVIAKLRQTAIAR